MEQADLWGGQAMVRIAAEGLQPTPPYFTVWYTYYSSQLPDLSRVVDRLAATGQPFTPAELDALWQRFFSYDREQKVVRDTGERIQGALAQLIDLLRSAGVDAGRYVGTLRQFSARLDIPELEPLRSLLDVIVTETELVARLNQELEGRIQATAAEMEELRRSLDGERREADTDALTGLPNRRAIFENLTTLFSLARHLNRNAIIAYIDLDNFKLINDHFGHEAGDRFLVEVGKRLNEGRDEDDIVDRLGGDEFLVACLSHDSESGEQTSLTVLKRQLSAQIAGEYWLGDVHLVYPGASLGVIEVDPARLDADSALRAADAAMYSDKKGKRKTPFLNID